MSAASWLGFPRAETTIACSGAEHRLRWEHGELHALDHGDPDAERALVALGGEPCACVELLDAWAQHASDLRVLVLGTRGAGDRIPAPEQLESPGVARARQGGWFVGARPVAMTSRSRMTTFVGSAQAAAGSGPDVDPELARMERLARLLSLGGGIDRRLVATVAAHWRERRAAAPAAQIEAAIQGRLLCSLRDWLGSVELELVFEIRPEADPSPSLTADAGLLRARLPFSWLVDVWGRGLETIWGRFCLAASTSDGRSWELLTVGPDLGKPGVIRVELPS